jgi:hypothetical protein
MSSQGFGMPSWWQTPSQQPQQKKEKQSENSEASLAMSRIQKFWEQKKQQNANLANQRKMNANRARNSFQISILKELLENCRKIKIKGGKTYFHEIIIPIISEDDTNKFPWLSFLGKRQVNETVVSASITFDYDSTKRFFWKSNKSDVVSLPAEHYYDQAVDNAVENIKIQKLIEQFWGQDPKFWIYGNHQVLKIVNAENSTITDNVETFLQNLLDKPQYTIGGLVLNTLVIENSTRKLNEIISRKLTQDQFIRRLQSPYPSEHYFPKTYAQIEKTDTDNIKDFPTLKEVSPAYTSNTSYNDFWGKDRRLPKQIQELIPEAYQNNSNYKKYTLPDEKQSSIQMSVIVPEDRIDEYKQYFNRYREQILLPERIPITVNIIDKCYDVVEMEEICLKNYLKDPKNIIITKENGQAIPEKRENEEGGGLKYYIDEANDFMFYRCSDNFPAERNNTRGFVDFSVTLVKLTASEEFYVPLTDIEDALEKYKNTKVFVLMPTGITYNRTASKRIADEHNKGNYEIDIVSAHHCQAGTNKKVHRLIPVEDYVFINQNLSGGKRTKKLTKTRKPKTTSKTTKETKQKKSGVTKTETKSPKKSTKENVKSKPNTTQKSTTSKKTTEKKTAKRA